jgi:hypothetical protein
MLADTSARPHTKLLTLPPSPTHDALVERNVSQCFLQRQRHLLIRRDRVSPPCGLAA